MVWCRNKKYKIVVYSYNIPTLFLQHYSYSKIASYFIFLISFFTIQDLFVYTHVLLYRLFYALQYT